MQLIDTHCHIHEITGDDTSDYSVSVKWHKAGITDAKEVIDTATAAGVSTMICVGTTLSDSKLAVNFAQKQPKCVASIGIHPHEAQVFNNQSGACKELETLASSKKVVAIGECGLDYYYNHSPKQVQKEVLEFQLDVASRHSLPVIFHVRDAFDDFWPIFDNFTGLKGVIHSFTANTSVLTQSLKRNLLIGLNGIMTFTKDKKQLEAARTVPIESLVLETDAPFLTPVPLRGTICEPKHVRVVAEFLSRLRDEQLEVIASKTTNNARKLFNLP